MAVNKRRAARPKANSWDKISAREPGETLTNRDVHQGQQLDRGKLRTRRSRTPVVLASVVIGAIVAAAVWVLYSVIAVALTSVGTSLGAAPHATEPGAYYMETTTTGQGGAVVTCYRPLTEDGEPDPLATCYDHAADVPLPDGSSDVRGDTTAQGSTTVVKQLTSVSPFKLFVALASGLLVTLVLGTWSARGVGAANLMSTTSDINQYPNDQHIALPEEIQRSFDWFPDAGAHSDVQVSSVISHVMLKQKGLGTVDVTQRAPKDLVDENGDVTYYAGEAVEDDEGEPVTRSLPIIDEAFGNDLFEASGLPQDKALRKAYDTTAIPYNPDGKDRAKLGTYKTVADLIKTDWSFPDYEVQRPAGAYLVDTAPVNTMVLAITRAGKGQTYIEPQIDMWSREKNPSNMVINDPKGELLVKFYVPLVMRGYEPVQFNLINPLATDIYNLLGLAAEAAREGDATKCAVYVENIADVFFPLDGGEDPVWPHAANNAFKRAAYGLIDFYLEEERELRAAAAATGMDPESLNKRLDDMWGASTLYNCYQLFVQLTSKKVKNPEAELEKKVKAGQFNDDEPGLAEEQEKAAAQAFLWEGKAEQDMLTLYFNATEALPRNTMRTLIGNANNALRAMAGAEKMLASVYGIAITAMSFFTDPTISTLTSGKPSQNTDLGGLSFPRRFGVRFAANYLKRDHLKGLQARWSAYGDDMFSHDLGEDFEHSDIVGREGWARYYFKGKFPTDQAWIKLELVNPQTKMLVRTFYLHFKKSYQVSLSGRHYVTEPVTGKKVVKNGVLRELRPVREGTGKDATIVSFEPADTTYPQARLDFAGGGNPEIVEDAARAITQTMVRYSELPKAVFLVTPPHLMKYAKLILILVKQLVDLNFDKSYMTKSDQKPLYKTRFMLDELGNLQSEGHGIAGFETMLSIGLGQEQQFTLILQTLQQLRDVYGESVDKIVQGNTSNIVFLKSIDDSMIETLEKMSGKTHRSYIDSKQVSQDVDRVVGGKTEGRVTYTMNTKEEPLISYNDMAFIPPRNSIVFRAGDAPVWNRNETILPMSWRLLKDTITHPGHDYTLQDIPTLSSAIDFDVRNNQPDFVRMLDKRMRQAVRAADAKTLYQETYRYRDVDIERLDPDVYSDEVMEIITLMTAADEGHDPGAPTVVDPEAYEATMMLDEDQFIENVELARQVAERETARAERERLVYAEETISKEMLINPDGSAKIKTLDAEISEAYRSTQTDLEQDREHFRVGGDGELRSADGSQTYISQVRSSAYTRAARQINDQATRQRSRVFAEADITEEDIESLSTVQVHAAFYQYLASLPSWEMLADGQFDRAMAIEMRSK
ncbi:type IV secretory system conjugative DNA transfer VirD4/TraG family protein [Promicromonospora sp. AC04]|uniref:type IV secretory system conjugative DNA transfer family protein n=1 Tax=Promicromonospora sp. AC04 TaxID=2135723 RepID=UPI000D34DA74|nr:type IV secretory system conjugative DNA transfer family protein [Promicromonospora sp. AC04]PUB32488.1 type IV secretory system conjugative DNA transfer VirD4/TraG family protein [Promicromonospora sp. AC04]